MTEMILSEMKQPDSPPQILAKRRYGLLPGVLIENPGQLALSELVISTKSSEQEQELSEPCSPAISSVEFSASPLSSLSSSPASSICSTPSTSRPGTPTPHVASEPSSPVSPQPYNLVIRPYRLEDQENVEVIGDLCYPPNIETTESFLAKLEIGDSFVAVDSVTGVTAAYCIGLPWHKEPLPINASPTKESFEGADVYVVHDIAVHPDWRGAGLASSLLEKLLSCARERAFAKAVLVAINPTARIVWGKKGFVPMSCANDSGGYGPLATKMELFL